MAKNTIPRGETSVVRHVFIRDSSQTDGRGLTDLAYNTGSLTAYYLYPGGTATSITLETISTLGTYAAPTSNAHLRFKEVDKTNMPGWYELHFHNDWFSIANARRGASLQLKGAANMAAMNLEIDVIGFGIQSATPDVNTKTITNGIIVANTFGTGVLGTSADLADAFLARNEEGGSDGGRTVSQCLSLGRNKWTLVGTTLTAYDATDTTPLWTSTVTINEDGLITASDPS